MKQRQATGYRLQATGTAGTAGRKHVVPAACSLRPAASRRGATLIEALAGLAILGTLLVSVLLASGKMHRQRGRTAQRLEAVRVADRLLEGWWQKRDEFPRDGQGTVEPGGDGRAWSWRTTVVENEAARKLACEVVALEVFAPEAAAETPAGKAPACRVEVLLPQKGTAGGTAGLGPGA